MWLVRSWLIGLVAAISLLAQGASKAEPVKIVYLDRALSN